jgi:hypothetical protein
MQPKHKPSDDAPPSTYIEWEQRKSANSGQGEDPIGGQLPPQPATSPWRDPAPANVGPEEAA